MSSCNTEMMTSSSAESSSAATALELCTEGLGSESGGGYGLEVADLEAMASSSSSPSPAEASPEMWPADAHVAKAKRRREFPPAMKRKVGLLMRSERKDGRLILTEVQIERPEVFHVSRQDGRLRLHLVKEEEEEEEEEEEVRRSDDHKKVVVGTNCQEMAAGWWPEHGRRCMTTA